MYGYMIEFYKSFFLRDSLFDEYSIKVFHIG